MVVKPRGYRLKCPDIYMNNTKLKKKVKYLGMIISIIKKCHDVSTDVKLQLFHAYCCTMYFSQLWVNFNKGTCLKLKVAYHNMRRRMGQSLVVGLLIMISIMFTYILWF